MTARCNLRLFSYPLAFDFPWVKFGLGLAKPDLQKSDKLYTGLGKFDEKNCSLAFFRGDEHFAVQLIN